MKKFLLGVMMTASIAVTAQADVKVNKDMNLLFNTTPVTAQVEQLSTQEMKATQGEWFWAAPYLWGAGAGVYSYGVSCSNCTAWGYVASAGVGAISPINSYYRFAATTAVSTSWGLGSRWGWW